MPGGQYAGFEEPEATIEQLDEFRLATFVELVFGRGAETDLEDSIGCRVDQRTGRVGDQVKPVDRWLPGHPCESLMTLANLGLDRSTRGDGCASMATRAVPCDPLRMASTSKKSEPNDCVFCGIGSGQLPADVVWEDGAVMAFLDRTPLFKGHTLVVPRTHVETLPELVDTSQLFQRVQSISWAMEEALGAAGSFVAINNRVSQSVPHLHVHVVPRNFKDGLRGFFWPRTSYEDAEESAAFATTLRSWLENRELGETTDEATDV